MSAKSIVMKPLFRCRVCVDRKKESKYNPPHDVSDYEDMDWKEYLAYREACFQESIDSLMRAGIRVLVDEYK